MHDLLLSGTTNIAGLDYGLEFYSIALTTVSLNSFYYENTTTT